ncbi:MAG: hypothetical protein AVDCRST_MAG83-1741 [uncultured Arthrobacter sp.]|uniref:Uncharacterized protein n=1 Tax=uncultured Arthrobacter sp. TaxID=114050 RepID=A0A6J4I821_9MICC|nr:hypothetical protein [uncultured Arthrobacter sp.]CAA9242946.1 MAG: hypothetical protein AVDCRST_MAG83-1741 [uncultured Arthrobacter sp.]
MAITTRDGLISAIAAGRTVQFQKGSVGAAVGAFAAHYRTAGNPAPPAVSAPTTTGNALSRTSQGAMAIPAPSNTSYISSFEGGAAAAQTLMLSDRLVEFGGLSSIVTTAQAVSALALPARATGATDVELWLEIYNAGGATASATVTASYTNQAGTAGRTATLVGGVPASGWTLGRTYPFALATGDTGVQSVQSLTIGTSSGTAGNVGLVLRRTLLTGFVPVAGGGFQLGWAETDLQQCPDDACLELISLLTATSTGSILGNFGIAQG